MFPKKKKIHFIGIGGIGMSGIAEILINKGYAISGSDINPSENTEHLKKIGASIYIGHREENVGDADVVVYTSAVNLQTNPEIIAANKQKIPTIRRAEMLAEISRLNYCIAVAGTHGKTTATSLIALVLIKAGIDPTVVVGGRLKDLGGTNARLGYGEWSVVEADEFDRSFLQLTPTIAVINNIEKEHLDIYADFADLATTFSKFANMTPFYGFIAAGIDCDGIRSILPNLNRQVITFGLADDADYRATNIKYNGFSSTCDVYEFGTLLGKMTLKIPGEFNIKNALTAVLIARQFEIPFETIISAISEFYGAFRRFEIKGEKHGVTIIDDYAHHPSEIKATLKGARNHLEKRIIAIFEPHTFTRTRDFYKDFALSFGDADIVYITDIYPAREEPIPGITSKTIVDAANQAGISHIHYADNKDKLLKELKELAQPNDTFITIGAGPIYQFGERLLAEL